MELDLPPLSLSYHLLGGVCVAYLSLKGVLQILNCRKASEGSVFLISHKFESEQGKSDIELQDHVAHVTKGHSYQASKLRTCVRPVSLKSSL